MIRNCVCLGVLGLPIFCLKGLTVPITCLYHMGFFNFDILYYIGSSTLSTFIMCDNRSLLTQCACGAVGVWCMLCMLCPGSRRQAASNLMLTAICCKASVTWMSQPDRPGHLAQLPTLVITSFSAVASCTAKHHQTFDTALSSLPLVMSALPLHRWCRCHVETT